MSGFIERSKAFAPIRSQYGFSHTGPATQRADIASATAQGDPQEASRQYVTKAVGGQKCRELQRRQADHARLRKVRLAIAEERERRLALGETMDTIHPVLKALHTTLLERLIAEEEAAMVAARAAAQQEQDSGFRQKRGRPDGGAAQPAAYSAAVEEGTAFDRRRNAAAKAERTAAWQAKQEDRVAEAVQKRVLGDGGKQ